MPVMKAKVRRTILNVFLCCAVLTISADAQTFKTLLSFDGPNGANPDLTSLTQSLDGKLYGTTEAGGENNQGTVFRISPKGTLKTLYSFCATTNCGDGAFPSGGLVLATNGSFYGVTSEGGKYGLGTIFKITPLGVLKTLYSFCAQPNCTDGFAPWSGLVQASDGNFYGTTSGGGNSDNGTIFKITSSGALTTVYSFCNKAKCKDGSFPIGRLVQGNDGELYGTTFYTSSQGAGLGTVYKITRKGVFTHLHTFMSKEGAHPYAGLIQGADGDFYAGISSGGSNHTQAGTIIKITPSGMLTVLHEFCPTDQNCGDGAGPSQLTQATDGNLYGTTTGGGVCGGCGTIFEISPVGVLKTLYDFCTQTDCPDGSDPAGGVVEATNGNFYGTTNTGGGSNNCSGGCGTAFAVSP
jgi:uncharacterized repeat protein (TIGR03803 family)